MLSSRNDMRQAVTRAMSHADALSALGSLRRDGCGLVPGAAVEEQLRQAIGPDFDRQAATFAAAWNGMGTDHHMADNGRYRERTFATYLIYEAGGPFERAADRPHFQATKFNPVNGGKDRVFDPTPEVLVDTPIMRAILEGLRTAGEAVLPYRCWTVEVHQFRIKTSADETGQPTPEGVHRDGVDFATVMLVGRHNVRGGESSVVTPDRKPLLKATMRAPFETLLLVDEVVRHGVTAILPVDAQRPAWRDTLVVTFKRLA